MRSWCFSFSFSSFELHASKASVKKKLLFSVFSRQNKAGPIGKMRNKEFETLYPVSTALCVSQRPGPIIHSSFPYLSLLRMKDKQKKTKSSWLAWCFCMKALLLSRPSPHPVPTSLQPWPYIIFQAQCSSSSSAFSSSLPFSTSTRIKRS